MKQFAESYPVPVLNQFIAVERELKNMKPISQQAVAKLLVLENIRKEVTEEEVSTSMEEVFLQSIISRISWSHHIVLKNY